MKKTLFLDIDGVLHDKYAAEIDNLRTFEEIAASRECFIWANHLHRTLAGNDVDIVVHSNWRLNTGFTNSQFKLLLRLLGNRYVGTTPEFANTDSLGTQRYDCIKVYIKDNGVTDYRILDDAHEEFPYGLPELIICHPERGVSDQTVLEKVRVWLDENTPVKP